MSRTGRKKPAGGSIGFDGSGSHLAIWVAVALVSVLGHELGHALAARRMGATASITLAGLGGLTRSTRAEPMGRTESAFLTVAGPLAGALKMPYPRFLAANVSGGICWAGGTTALVYFAGMAAERWLSRFSWVALVIAIHDHNPIAPDVPKMLAGGTTAKVYELGVDVELNGRFRDSAPRREGW